MLDLRQLTCHPDPFDFAQDKGPRRIWVQLDGVRKEPDSSRRDFRQRPAGMTREWIRANGLWG